MPAMKLFILFVCCLPFAMSASLGCPNSEDISPCTCKRVAFGLRVICAKFNTTASLVKAFRILRDYRLHTVLLHGLYFQETLPDNLFDGMQIKEINVENSNLRFPHPAFKGLDASLNVLTLAKQSMIKSNDRFTLARLTHLQELGVETNKMERVEDRWLNEKVPNVEKVVLDFSQIAVIEDHAFSSLKLLKEISVAENRIKVVKRSMLPRPALHLIRIDLSHNQIKTLPYDFFFEMPSLKEMILIGNDLKTLPEATWKPVWQQLDQIYLIDNLIECTSDLEWIKKYKKRYLLTGNCHLPKEMAGKPITDMYNT